MEKSDNVPSQGIDDLVGYLRDISFLNRMRNPDRAEAKPFSYFWFFVVWMFLVALIGGCILFVFLATMNTPLAAG